MLTDLYRFISPSSDKTCTSLVKRGAENACFCFKGPRLRNIFHILKRRPRGIVPEGQSAIITCGHFIMQMSLQVSAWFPIQKQDKIDKIEEMNTSWVSERWDRKRLACREEDPFGIDRHRVDDSVVPAEVEYEGTFRTFPFLNIVSTSRSRGERILCRMDSKSPNWFFMMCQCGHCFASR